LAAALSARALNDVRGLKDEAAALEKPTEDIRAAKQLLKNRLQPSR
jgi:hypothetical protein